tara:strand:- start:440 stop:916 length:477 start_codon:yes stop_codon:yes gene_type:complete
LFKENQIRGFSNQEVSYEDFLAKLKQYSLEGFDAYIGTDSQVIKNKVSVVTCVCLYKLGAKKNEIFYIKNRVPADRLPTLRARMLHEAYKSLEAAIDIDPLIDGELIVHLDIGTDPRRSKSARFQKELQVLVRSQGFGCEVKPNSWASSSVADMFTKT